MIRTRLCSKCLVLIILCNLNLYQCSCPDACEPCLQDHLYCTNPGLTEMPRISDFNLKKVTIQKQTFASSDLSNSNFTTYVKVEQLSIRSSNINKVLPYTFLRLTLLRSLDLSDHLELVVDQNAFSGLNLAALKLDNMGIITLDLDAFQGLTVRSLSIQSSKLLALPLKLIQPLSNGLSKLFLKNNHLRTLDPRLQPIFQNLETLELPKNPFNCNCSILWLSELLRRSASQALDASDEQFPSCVSPAEFRKKFLHNITSKLKNCSPPTIVRIDVTFESHSSAIIDCITDDRKDVHYKTFVGWLPHSETSVDVTHLKHSVKVVRHSLFDRYLCRAVNPNGNSEIGFRIEWLTLPKGLNVSLRATSESTDNRVETRGILWRHMFSLFEMICAVVGTLVITVTIFLIFCCCCRCHIHIPFGDKRRKLQYMTPHNYEETVYKDQRRFRETDIDGNLFPPPPPTPPPFSVNRMLL